MPKKNRILEQPALEPVDPVTLRKEALARKLAFWLGRHEQESYVSPGGYRLTKIVRCGECGGQKESAA